MNALFTFLFIVIVRSDNCILLILDQISKITKNEESVLLLDQYGSHITDKVTNYAKLKNIIIKYVPIGMTSKYQPLDVSINGILKNKISKKYATFISLKSSRIFGTT